jgi:hypothetical protein
MAGSTWTRDDIRALFASELERNPAQRALDVAMSGWGYDYHNPAAKARENDAIVRRLAVAALTSAASRASRLEAEYKRDRVPPISREAPYPTTLAKSAMACARRIAEDARSRASRIESLEAPGPNAQSRRFHDERVVLEDLVAADVELVLAAQVIDDFAASLTQDALESAATSAIAVERLHALDAFLEARGTQTIV